MASKAKNFVKFGILEVVQWLRSELGVKTKPFLPSGPEGNPSCRIAIISDWQAWCSDQQLNPFQVFRKELAKNYGVTFQFFHLEGENLLPRIPLTIFDVVMVKLSYRTSPNRAQAIVKNIKDNIGASPLIYMDGDDDLCVQWGGVISEVDLYVKCHAFIDRERYTIKYQGKSNLHDYAIKNFGHVLTWADYGGPQQEPLIIESSGVVSDPDIAKITVGWNMALSKDILALWQRAKSQPDVQKTVDCVFRGSIKTETITGYMRQKARSIIESLGDEFDIRVSNSHVSLIEYYQELMESRICVSPFGFGELCWRDFESVLCRTLLIKPDMSHVQTSPNIFQPYVTYVPVRWDLADLDEVCRYYLRNKEERDRIIKNAFQVLDEYYNEHQFERDVFSIISRVRRSHL